MRYFPYYVTFSLKFSHFFLFAAIKHANKRTTCSKRRAYSGQWRCKMTIDLPRKIASASDTAAISTQSATPTGNEQSWTAVGKAKEDDRATRRVVRRPAYRLCRRQLDHKPEKRSNRQKTGKSRFLQLSSGFAFCCGQTNLIFCAQHWRRARFFRPFAALIKLAGQSLPCILAACLDCL